MSRTLLNRRLFKKLLVQQSRQFVLPIFLGIVVGSTVAYAGTSLTAALHPASSVPTQIITVKVSTPATTKTIPPVTTPAPAVTATPKVVAKTAPPTVVTPAPPTVVAIPTSSVSNLVPSTPTSTPTAPTTPNTIPSSTPSTSTSPPTTPPATTNSYTSSNWSGYLATNSSYTSVSGSWVVPTPTGNGVNTSADAAWVGIGGVTNSDLIQIGTDDTVTASGQASSEAFYEMLPAASVQIPNFPVSLGESIHASVVETSLNQWLLIITDNTTGQTYTSNVSYTSSHSSAEWIQEDPSYSNNRLVPFDFFGSIPFSQASMVSAGATSNLTDANIASITMINRLGHTVATPSAVASDGASFTVTRGAN